MAFERSVTANHGSAVGVKRFRLGGFKDHALVGVRRFKA
jgi:hypothetical protein